MNYPDSEQSPDKELFAAYNSKDGRVFMDSGLIHDIHFDIVNGKRVFRRFACVNESMPII